MTFPRTYDLEDPAAYFQAVVLPRKQRKLSRALWGLVNRKVGPTAGGDDNEERGGGGGGKGGGKACFSCGEVGHIARDCPKPGEKEEPRGGGDSGAHPKAKAKASPQKAPGGQRQYPAGRRLGNWETTHSIKAAPKDKAGKRLCWDFSCWSGCPHKAQDCPNSHEQIVSTAGLPWEVVAQLMRRGGLKTSKAIPPGEVDTRVDALRSQARSEKEASKAEGGVRTVGGRG